MLINRPPMGWNSWNTFGSNISDELIRETADKIVSSGLKDAGYEYVVIDDCWSLRERNAEGHIVPDPEKFPHGMKDLADYVHSKGLKFGMYSCDGDKTCAGYPGSYNYEFVDAKDFADWGVDYLKYDNCYKPGNRSGRFLYNRMSMALKASGRDIVFSACNWGTEEVHTWIRSTGAHLYRSTGDISDCFASVKGLANSQMNVWGYSAPGCFNDIDMLICGMYGKGNVAVGGCNDTEYKTHFALWCFFGSPLMIGCDLRNINDTTLDLLKNKDLIAINQDAEARPPFLLNATFSDTNGNNSYLQFSAIKHLENGEYAIGFFNYADYESVVPCDFENMGLTADDKFGFEMREIFTGETLNAFEKHYPTVEAHGCKIYRAKLIPAK